MSSLYRTQPFRTTHYSPDGRGRDTYIQTNNGGVFKGGSPLRLFEPQRTVKRQFSPTSPRLDAKPLKYTHDGTGRDTYIGCNHGGLFSSYDKHSFYTALRTYSPRPSYERKEVLVKTQNSWFRSKNKEVSYQEELSKRLSEPKKSFGDSSPKSGSGDMKKTMRTTIS
ncbi:unnamed protein product [Blepharisma stoltei]|uniref:Uncharacterized protein n=1 Tax=Blepharisma stoltei TaxID=1481888 RepID=A0AAU9K8T7_9CILI|nr:unnamed protein product [Blepharisma stoltei]